MNVRHAIAATVTVVALTAGTASFADPAYISDDEGYSRLYQWETHLDQRINTALQQRTIDPYRAWRLQKQLDNVEIQSLQAYYQSENGIDRDAFRRFADQLRRIGQQLGEPRWQDENWGQPGYGPGPSPGYGPGPGYDQQGYGPPPPPSGYAYYQQGDYEAQCRRSNRAAGTIFGALGGGLIGGAASRGNAGAIVGGVVLGGLLGNTLASDIDCDDHRYAFEVYNQSFNGDIGREYRWRHGDHYGTIMATREYYRGDRVCRDFHAVNYRYGSPVVRDGTVCRGDEGSWRFQ